MFGLPEPTGLKMTRGLPMSATVSPLPRLRSSRPTRAGRSTLVRGEGSTVWDDVRQELPRPLRRPRGRGDRATATRRSSGRSASRRRSSSSTPTSSRVPVRARAAEAIARAGAGAARRKSSSSTPAPRPTRTRCAWRAGSTRADRRPLLRRRLPRPHGGRDLGGGPGEVPGARQARRPRPPLRPLRRPRRGRGGHGRERRGGSPRADPEHGRSHHRARRRTSRVCARSATSAGAKLIYDEVQTGFGRTGTFFYAGRHGVVPDLITLAKGIGSGFPMGAVLVSDEIAATVKPEDYGTTFGGGPLACAAAEATVRVIRGGGTARQRPRGVDSACGRALGRSARCPRGAGRRVPAGRRARPAGQARARGAARARLPRRRQRSARRRFAFFRRSS